MDQFDFNKKSLNFEEHQVDPQAMLEFLTIAEDLKAAMQNGDVEAKKRLGSLKPILAKLLDYLINNVNNPHIDPLLLEFIQRVLGLKNKEKDSETVQEKREREISEEKEKHEYRMVMYEVYKIINPHQLAGETSLENFLNNIKLYGAEVARQYSGASFESIVNTDKIEEEARKGGFVEAVLSTTKNNDRGRGM